MPCTSVVHTQNSRSLVMIRGLEELVPEVLRAENAPGINLALAHDGQLIWEGAYGYADAATGAPTTPQTVFRSGSMGKTYVAAAILQLVEQGLIGIDDPISQHLPFRVQNPHGGDVTIFHLLTHTSGLGGDAAGSVFGKPRPLEQVVLEQLAKLTQPIWGLQPTWAGPPGEEERYSNLGVAILGLIVQYKNPNGLSFSDYVERKIMQPLGLIWSRYPPAQSKDYLGPDLWRRMSAGYTSLGPGMWIPTPLVYFEEFPAGGFVSIPREHLRFLMALMKGGELEGQRILQAETVATMLKPQLPGPLVLYGTTFANDQQGLIWRLRNWSSPHRSFHHTGGHMFGWRTLSIAWPEYQTALVFAINHWSALASNTVPGQIQAYIEACLQAQLPALGTLPETENLVWNLSYLRGLLYMEAYRYGIGVPERLESIEIERLASQALCQTWCDSELAWDQKAFIAGIQDMSAVDATADAIHAFAHSNRMRIDLVEARQIFRTLGAKRETFASLAGLLLADAAPES